ncbi:CDGSH iron-sulfur domain-containing protein [Specibacter sp. NPDC057265]|uniref:CDGSH iron-sulfur domain-containing protein n=1 Tax=Specibacter sp. NPDC057265 TaxID=3346075 RepID=UPI00363E24B0
MSAASEQEIVVCPDGPLLVRGDFEIVSTTGQDIPRRRKTVALCRCGASGIKPFCDGTHKLIGFRSEPPASPDPSTAAGQAGDAG